MRPQAHANGGAWKVVIHGGAWDIPDEAVADHCHGVRAACEIAANLLRNGRPALEAVEQAIIAMEDDPTFDAGVGSFLNSAGEVEMDAILATDAFELGACCAVKNVKNPIRLARVVMEHTKNVMVVGEGCVRLAQEFHLPMCTTEELLVGRELERYQQLRETQGYDSKTSFAKARSAEPKPLPGGLSRRGKVNGMGTVGVVCVDQSGKMAVGLSTGGTPLKRPGRVGDTPLWGSGAYVERTLGGAACTGYGEDLVRVLFSRTAVDALRAGRSAADAAQDAVDVLGSRVKGLGGLIVLSYEPGAAGVGLAFNTPRMAFAFQTSEDAAPNVGIEPADLARLNRLAPTRGVSRL